MRLQLIDCKRKSLYTHPGFKTRVSVRLFSTEYLWDTLISSHFNGAAGFIRMFAPTIKMIKYSTHVIELLQFAHCYWLIHFFLYTAS